MTASNLYERVVDTRLKKLSAIWESRVGQPALRLSCESWVRQKGGWLAAVVGCAVLVPAIWFGAPATVIFPLAVVVPILSAALILSAIPPTKKYMKATMHYLGLPEKPAITVRAMQSPADFDIWLLKTRKHHSPMDDS